ncbi:MAG TPA: hypothetical protein VGV10_07410 [Thermoleophilaceae bacterium]|nr:hypothetical protein [Thermoleophilaceae bacterium]
MCVQRSWLHQRFAAGASQEEIGRELGLHGSTVAYWARKYGLKAKGSEKFAARGATDRAQLEALAAQGATLKEMGEALERSISTVRYWLARWDIDRAARTRRVDPAVAPKKVERRCGRHGLTVFHLEVRGYYRCSRCRQEHVSSWRRRVKATLVREAGGRCRLCGYERCQAALAFHHVDRADKVFAISHEGLTRSLERARIEALKCVLLCSNCHAEVEAGYRTCRVSEEPNGLAHPKTPRGGLEPP